MQLVEPVFLESDFKGKSQILIIAKTWGSANVFVNSTDLRKFKNIKIEFLCRNIQLGSDTNKHNTTILCLAGAKDTEINKTWLSRCIAKDMNIIYYENITPKVG